MREGSRRKEGDNHTWASMPWSLGVRSDGEGFVCQIPSILRLGRDVGTK
jgi:hypothetical protein